MKFKALILLPTLFVGILIAMKIQSPDGLILGIIFVCAVGMNLK